AGEVVAGRIIELMKKTSMPNGIGELGFGPADVRDLAASSVRQLRPIANAPRETNLVDIENIFAASINYW
ncbi:MAG: alcohol dehydrogenase, partial [Gammaproteobacteria bacterium]|nr:alcohol dehydrogenase [Gammaproteobacteria bacterium]